MSPFAIAEYISEVGNTRDRWRLLVWEGPTVHFQSLAMPERPHYTYPNNDRVDIAHHVSDRYNEVVVEYENTQGNRVVTTVERISIDRRRRRQLMIKAGRLTLTQANTLRDTAIKEWSQRRYSARISLTPEESLFTRNRRPADLTSVRASEWVQIDGYEPMLITGTVYRSRDDQLQVTIGAKEFTIDDQIKAMEKALEAIEDHRDIAIGSRTY
jgi:hypothetical protein